MTAHQMIPTPCFRCCTNDMAASGPTDGLCWACRGEVAANRSDARDELVRVLFTGHGFRHHDYPADMPRRRQS